MIKTVTSLGDFNTSTPGFEDYDEASMLKISNTIIDWYLYNLIKCEKIDEIIIAASQMSASWNYLQEKSKFIKKLTLVDNGLHLTRIIDSILYASPLDLRSLAKKDDFIFSTHMDCYFGEDRLSSFTELSNGCKFAGYTTEYCKIHIGSRVFPYFCDAATIGQISWLRSNGIKYGWNTPITKLIAQNYSSLAIQPIKLGTTEIEKCQVFDGLQEGSLILAIKKDLGKIPSTDCIECGDANIINKDICHVKNLFYQLPNAYNYNLTSFVTKYVILGETLPTSITASLKLQLSQIKNSCLYNEIMNSRQKTVIDKSQLL